MAPEMDSAQVADEFTVFARHGLGQLTRVYGTKPVHPAEGMAQLIAYQRWIWENTRVPIGLLAHEECLTGVGAWTATTYPTPLAWAASFDPALVRQMGREIGATLAALGVHQGLAPVVDVVRDARWGRVEETLGEDPYVVGTLGAAYVQGVQEAGVVATLKHFLSYSASQSARNLAPVHAGPREVRDVFLPPFEMALLDGGAGSVMPAYVDLDGEPMHANPYYLTEVLRGEWGFQGTVVSDYFGVEFLERQHHVAADLGEAGVQALLAGVDVELPTGMAFRAGLADRAEEDLALQQAIDQACARVLNQKERLGLLDLAAEISRLEALAHNLPQRLDPPQHRATAARLAQESVVLLANRVVAEPSPKPAAALAELAGSEAATDQTDQTDQTVLMAPPQDDVATGAGQVWVAPAGQPQGSAFLPLRPRPGLRLAVIGPNADRPAALFGCYSFVNHVLSHHSDQPRELEAPSLLEALRAEFEPAGASLEFALGCSVREPDRSGFEAAVQLAQRSDVVVAVVGDQSGLFGQGTSGEGCDAESLDLPGVQTELVEVLLATGRPVVLVALVGRPYAIGELARRAAATVLAFFPGEAGASAIAGVLSGRLEPSGHLPVSLPRGLPALPYSYLHAPLVDPNGVSPIDTTPQFSFGHGLSYSRFEFSDFSATPMVATDSWIEVRVTVANQGERDSCLLVQLYGCDLVASLVRPTHQLVAYARLELAAGQRWRLDFRVPTSRFGLTDRQLRRVVEPGEVRLWLGWDADHPATEALPVNLTGLVCPLGPNSPRLVTWSAEPLST